MNNEVDVFGRQLFILSLLCKGRDLMAPWKLETVMWKIYKIEPGFVLKRPSKLVPKHRRVVSARMWTALARPTLGT